MYYITTQTQDYLDEYSRITQYIFNSTVLCVRMDDNYIEIVEKLDAHPNVHAVRSDPSRLTIAYAPENPNTDQIPQDLFDHIVTCITDTNWMFEAGESRNAERHRWSGGIYSDPILPARKHPEGFELQVHLVFV